MSCKVVLELAEWVRRRVRLASWEFNGAVGELRGVFGIHIAQLAAQYGIDVEDDLASILPPPEEDSET